MGAKEKIKIMLVLRGKTQVELAEMTGKSYQNIRNKLARDNIQYNAVEQIADLLGFDIVFKDRETGKEV